MAAGIGLFLGFIALKNAGIVVDHPATLVALGDLSSFAPIACILGFVTITALSANRRGHHWHPVRDCIGLDIRRYRIQRHRCNAAFTGSGISAT
jgi:hypothetical protein